MIVFFLITWQTTWSRCVLRPLRENRQKERERESSWINQPRGAHEIRLDETVRNPSRRRRKDDVWWAGKTLLLAEDQQCGTSSLLLILLLLPLHLYINTMSLLFFLLFSREKRGQTRNKHCRGIATHIVASRVTILSLSLSLGYAIVNTKKDARNKKRKKIKMGGLVSLI